MLLKFYFSLSLSVNLYIHLFLVTEQGGVGSVVDEPRHQVTIAQLPLNSLPK